jgi:rRNA maturation endonuclease Nob1
LDLFSKKRMKKCVYCSKALSEDSAFDVCESCGFQVWGEKMYNTIKKNMEDAKADGTLLYSE